MPQKLSSSCDPNIEHVIANCREVVHLQDSVYLKMIYVTEEGKEGQLIGVHACHKDGTLIDGGLLIVEKFGVWERQEIPENARLAMPFFDYEDNGKVKVVS